MAIKIYYIDDEPDLLEIFSETFSSENIQISTFTDTQVALKKILEVPPDLLFVDYRMPLMNGDKFSLQVPKEIPKILVTGDFNVKLETQFTAIFEKPFCVDEVMGFIKKSFSI